MIIKKIKPYFIKLIQTEEEFASTQRELFDKGYEWIDGTVVWLDNNFVKYPIYISNLPLLGSENKFNAIRENYNKKSNNILFIDNDINSFDIKLLRSTKLRNLNKINESY